MCFECECTLEIIPSNMFVSLLTSYSIEMQCEFLLFFCFFHSSVCRFIHIRLHVGKTHAPMRRVMMTKQRRKKKCQEKIIFIFPFFFYRKDDERSNAHILKLWLKMKETKEEQKKIVLNRLCQ